MKKINTQTQVTEETKATEIQNEQTEIKTEQPIVLNAEISSTHFGFTQDGNFTAILGIKGDEWEVAHGGLKLQEIPNACGIIADLLATLELPNWESLKGAYIRILSVGDKISKIGHLIKNKWFSFDEAFAFYMQVEKQPDGEPEKEVVENNGIN